ncbi:energy-coupling factor ABC transporter ATP-binding protein [Nocardia seriolae]|uniref:ABC transporter ATP-binding protein n=1 Tax=Nocardia seriolae TaxID=37332 RepID=A0A0B8N176_9NOCA|nr:ABC transporter ATP-binding protein [Nocardia seriolae]APA96966.1 Putative ABC transporter ATP-binding protein [Nocardia seriolae]MTJ65225.1 ATP-binding cassette domain-containing protein [Nocardia seriolae]MTJ70721.1 ATP-binding cassette domain-containing protein [Nocardia seriolae]MTJ86856.1 ATP-binding cassette domain-containing protein [Nocardia seriolae]MTK30851.1 ATP-binding cassette domain-containing protein [Nocardia seriolae]
MIEIEGVAHRFGEREVLKNLDLTLRENRIAVIGSNGSGKSTFARLLNGLQVPTDGEVRVDGLDTRKQGKAVRKLVGFVFQDPDVQIVMPTVAEDLAFGLKHHGVAKSEIADRVDATLAEYGLTEFRDHPAHLLSGGQKQLLAIAAVLSVRPKYVVFDEPTTLLDLRNKRRISGLLHELPQQLIVVSHDLELLTDFDRVLVFDDGRLVADGPPADTIPFYVAMHTAN